MTQKLYTQEELDAAVAREWEEIASDATELVALVGHCDDPECKGKWCVTARAFIEKIRARSGAKGAV